MKVGFNLNNSTEGPIKPCDAALEGDAAREAEERAEIDGTDPLVATCTGGKLQRNSIVYALVRLGCIWSNDAGCGLSLNIVEQKPGASPNIIVLQTNAAPDGGRVRRRRRA